ncbi:cytoglobin-1-like [Platysternon megacephalum]|uniref:Cytoglobin-1-like n=1 Tax=Platysternon megacephalum TaxID=55544 RepID=A0A4D9ELQ9_9SAUR|nr:cytoglobin-1-like [Platysternon megacephalum]
MLCGRCLCVWGHLCRDSQTTGHKFSPWRYTDSSDDLQWDPHVASKDEIWPFETFSPLAKHATLCYANGETEHLSMNLGSVNAGISFHLQSTWKTRIHFSCAFKETLSTFEAKRREKNNSFKN